MLVIGHQLYAFGQDAVDFLYLGFHPFDDRRRVGPKQFDDHTRHDLAEAVIGLDPAAHRTADAHVGQLFEKDRRAVRSLDDDVLDILNGGHQSY